MNFFEFISVFLLIYVVGACTVCSFLQIIHMVKLYFQTKNIKKNTCSICLEEVENIPLKCGHAFHDECVLEWFKINNTCPNCRCVVLNLNKGLV